MSPGERSRLGSRPQVVVHVLLVALGWVLFAWFWWLVAGHPWDSPGLRLLVLAAVLLFPLVTGLWIVHNQGIYRRLGPRRGVTTAPLHYSADFNGRRIDADWRVLQAARRVLVVCDGPVKRFRAERLAPALTNPPLAPLPEPLTAP